MARANRADTIADIVAGQIENVRRVISFNVVEGWARDVSEDIALDALNIVLEDRQGVSDYLREFFQEHLGDSTVNVIENEDYVDGSDRTRHT